MASSAKEEFYFIPLDQNVLSLSAIRHELEQFRQAFSLLREDLILISHTLPRIDGRIARLMMQNQLLLKSIDKQYFYELLLTASELYQNIPQTPSTATAPQAPWQAEDMEIRKYYEEEEGSDSDVVDYLP
ncbi:hypothetical protein N5P37_011450 [Trichoderma harzianum]|nr:hypothetical protein N5P37_011450 [Trichoderma harzianum]